MGGLIRPTRVLKVNRGTAGLLSQLGSPYYPWGDTCKGCKRNIKRGEDALYHIGLFFYAPFCIRCAERKGYVEFATVRTWVPVEEAETSKIDESVARACRNDAIRVLVQMGAQRSDALKYVWEAQVVTPDATADQLVTAVIKAGRKP